MTINKKLVMKVAKTLPQNVDIEDFVYKLYVAKEIALGEEDIRKGRVIPHEKVVKEINRWFQSRGLPALKEM